MVDADAIRTNRLSMGARGTFAWMLDKPDDWEFSAERMAADPAVRDGRHAIRAALAELEAVGLVRRVRFRADGKRRGVWRTRVDVRESTSVPWPGEGAKAQVVPTTAFRASEVRPSEPRPSETRPSNQPLTPRTETEHHHHRGGGGEGHRRQPGEPRWTSALDASWLAVADAALASDLAATKNIGNVPGWRHGWWENRRPLLELLGAQHPILDLDDEPLIEVAVEAIRAECEQCLDDWLAAGRPAVGDWLAGGGPAQGEAREWEF
jgi:hypothetical protein